MRTTAALAGVTVATLVVAAIATGNDDGSTPTPRPHSPVVEAAGVGLVAFDACESMTDELVTRSLEVLQDPARAAYGVPTPLMGFGFGMVDGVAEEAMDGAEQSAPLAGGAAADRSVSDTNVQVVGVDEPDLVETDGDRLFATSNGRLHVLDVSDGAPRPLGDVSLGVQGDPQLLLDGDRLLVLGSVWGDAPQSLLRDGDVAMPWMPGMTRLELFDVSADTPTLLAELEVEGQLVSARGIDGTVHAVISHQPMPVDPIVLEQAAESVQWRMDAPEFQQAMAEELEQTTPEDWLPQIAIADAGGTVQSRSAVDCTQVRATSQSQDTSMLTVLTFDVTDNDLAPEGSSAVLTNATTMTASADQLVVATPIVTQLDEPQPAETEQPAERADTDVATQEELTDDPAEPVEPVDPETVDELVEPDVVEPGFAPPAVRFDTRLHLFDLSPQGATYLASGEVPGNVLNQFSMDLWDGSLRVATTLGEPWMGGSESQVAVLQQRGDRLETVGSVGGLGKGERIYSVRFIGDRGYVVTFRQVDPLYTLDLTDPTDPTVKGELKITGYSAYLHPVGEHKLLGIGQEATTEGRRVGMQVSLFDTTDPENPERLSQVVMPNADTEAEYDHHAILVHEDTIALPYGRWFEPTSDNPEGYEVGAAVLDLADRVIALRGTVAPELTGEDKLDPWRSQIRRSVYVDGVLYLVGVGGVTAVDAQSLAPVGSIAFPVN